jgi:hypothetical protein
VAVRADADWAEGDEAAAAEPAEVEAAPPPGFESAARREHLSEAAALRGRGIAGGAADVEEVRSYCVFQGFGPRSMGCGAAAPAGCEETEMGMHGC